MPHYNTNQMTLDEKVKLLHRAKELCRVWWVDILDCSVSFYRTKIEMSFEEIMAKYTGQKVYVIHRNFPPENHLEIGFSTFTGPDYFLWMILDTELIPEITAGLAVS